jgi:hypothetical protein
MSRKLQTNDPDDAQLSPGGKAHVALANWDADETPERWTDLGHLPGTMRWLFPVIR